MKKMIVFLFFLAILMPAVSMAKNETLYVYNWTEYMPEQVISEFQKETGIKIVYSTYDSNEAMYAKIKVLKKNEGYDLVFPSTYFVDKMRREGLLGEIDKSKLSNLKNLDPSLLDKPYDPGNKFSIPYLWGSSSIAVNAKFVKPDTITSWNDLWRPEFKNRLVLNDDIREVFGMALMSLGFSGNSKDPVQIEAAFKKLETLKPNVRLYNSESPKLPFLNQEVYAGMIFNGEAYMASVENPDIKFIYPKEGTIFWIDNMIIPKNARNVDNAHKFMDFILRPEIAKQISKEIGYASPNQAARQLMDENVRNNKTIYPDPAVVSAGEFQVDIGDAILTYEKYWEKLKTGN